jgi:ketosteroid isomerase-like protein
METEKSAAEKLLADYASALNAANSEIIPKFFTPDGVFMPENNRPIKAARLGERSKTFLRNSHFQISYDVQDIEVNGEYAFVQAVAQTKTFDVGNNRETSQISQDFFVLRKEQEDWKIFRYLFNNVKEQ